MPSSISIPHLKRATTEFQLKLLFAFITVRTSSSSYHCFKVSSKELNKVVRKETGSDNDEVEE